MANVKQIETSLLTEHLRYTPLTIIDDIINTINLLIERAVDAVESGLLSTDPETLGFAARAAAENRIPHHDNDNDEDGQPSYLEMKSEIEEGVHQLETLLTTNVDRNFDRFEIFALRNIFAIGPELVPWVRLGHYDGLAAQQQQRQGGADVPSLESVRMARRKMQETRKLNHALLAERARNEAMLRQLRALTGGQAVKIEEKEDITNTPHTAATSTAKADFSFLASTHSAQALGMRPLSPDANVTAQQIQQPAPTPLTTNTSFTLAQLPALKALVEELRPRLVALQGGAGAVAGQGRFARERNEYVETQTMRILERRGVEADEGGAAVAAAARDVGGSAAARRVGKEEVEALERIVSVMSRNRKRGGTDDDEDEDDDEQGENARDEDAMEE